MDKITYLAELAEGLARWVPERERQDILRYYAEYFEEAGADREGEVVAELGDPWALSCRLAVEGGFVTQEAANRWTPPKKKKRSVEIVACVAIVMIVVAVAVASLASNVGRLVGGFVRGGSALNQATVVEGTDFGEAYVYSEPDVEFIESFDMTGGFWSMEDGDLDVFWAIDAEISLGDIIITGGEDYTLAIQQSSNLGGYRLNWEIQGDTLKIRDGSSGGHNIGFGDLEDIFSQFSVDVIITVPEGTTLRTVNAKTDMGNVFLSGLDVEVKVTGETDMGNVDGYDIWTAEKVELKSGMGNVTFSIGKDGLYSGMDIDLETDMGDVEADLECYESECAYELETDMGTVTINGVSRGNKAERKGTSSVKLDAESSMGDVDVYFLDDRWE